MIKEIKPINPKTGAIGPAYAVASLADVDDAVTRAKHAFLSMDFADAPRRAQALRAVAAQLRRRADEIVELAEFETGLPATPRLRGELERTCTQLELHAAACESGEHLDATIDHADPDALPAPRPDLRRINRPIGVVAVFGASNFPLAFSTAGGDTASALAAGCPVIVKGHPLHPGTGLLIAEEIQSACAAAGLPDGAFTHLLAEDHAIGAALVNHPDVAAVAFTGSTRGGRALMDQAAARPDPIPVFAEMSSLNPVVITAGALAEQRDALAEALTVSVCTFGGQLCTKPGLVFVPDSSFADDLQHRFEARGPETLLSASIAAAYSAGTGSPVTEATHVDPVVLRATAGEVASTPSLREEHFGPGVVVVTYETGQDLEDALDSIGGQLTATLHASSNEHPELQALIHQLSRLAGRVLFGGMPTGVSVTWAMQHGGPYPATSAAAHTSVGQTAARRFLRPVTFQSASTDALPPALLDANPSGLMRRVDGVLTRAATGSAKATRP